jgi:glycosyltransferase involved in cell wall biosynthesis
MAWGLDIEVVWTARTPRSKVAMTLGSATVDYDTLRTGGETRAERRLRIAQVAPLHESVPSPAYGGTERVVAWLTDALVHAGHDVTLFASGDSTTSAQLVPCCPRALRPSGCADPIAPHLVMIDQVARRAGEFDLIHFHIDYLHFPTSCHAQYLPVTTAHGRLDLPELAPLYRLYGDAPLVSISNAQRTPLPFANWRATVHHGMPLDTLHPVASPGSYLAFLGRISPEKGVEAAIDIAGRAGLPLRIAAKIDRVDRDYFKEHIEALFRLPHVEYLGEIDDAGKQALLGGALALLFPINWPEPFGLVMIEAMACGTPVIAFGRGSVPEVLEHGVSGYICSTREEAVDATSRVGGLSRAACRAAFERRFSAERMAAAYVNVYRGLVEQHHGARTLAGA